MPFSLAVVAKGVAAAGSLAGYPRARCAASGDHSVSAIWSRAPTSVWIGRQDASEHEELVELQQVVVVADQHLDVWNQQFGNGHVVAVNNSTILYRAGQRSCP